MSFILWQRPEFASQIVDILKSTILTNWNQSDLPCVPCTESVNSRKSCFWVAENHKITRINLRTFEHIFPWKSRNMFWNCDIDLAIAFINYKTTQRPHTWPLVHIPILNVVVAPTSRTYELLTNECTRCQISKVETAEGPKRVMLTLMLTQNNFICRVELVFIHRVANSDLHHLTLL